jgi:outer membrane protein OmpA-like peptidoglycan-associated protein
MKLVRITGPVVAALVVGACGAESKHASTPQRAAEEAAEEKGEAQKEAQEARSDADKARKESQDATRTQHEAEQNAQFAAQREAQADRQAAGTQSPRALRAGTTQLQAANADKDRGPRTTVPFAANSADLSADAKAKIDEAAKTLRANPQTRSAIVEGYSDDGGGESANVDLSRRRTDEVANYLASKGVSRERITTRALGSEYPVSKEETARGRARYRRVEIVIQPIGN